MASPCVTKEVSGTGAARLLEKSLEVVSPTELISCDLNCKKSTRHRATGCATEGVAAAARD
eukprot:6225396-Pyramimonas_sp.AAC.1